MAAGRLAVFWPSYLRKLTHGRAGRPLSCRVMASEMPWTIERVNCIVSYNVTYVEPGPGSSQVLVLTGP